MSAAGVFFFCRQVQVALSTRLGFAVITCVCYFTQYASGGLCILIMYIYLGSQHINLWYAKFCLFMYQTVVVWAGQ